MLRVLVPCKLNLFLAIHRKDESGYHELETVFVRSRALQDELVFERAETFHFECDSLPAEGNTVVRAVEILRAHTGKPFNYKITLKKGIPLRSGLGGGSSDAAFTLLALNDLEGLELSQEKLMELGAQIGMDVPFFLAQTEVALGTHYGEKITPLEALPANLKLSIELGEEHSTQASFVLWDEKGLHAQTKVETFLEALKSKDAQKILNAMHNDFEQLYPSALSSSPNTRRILSGSGGARVVACVDDN